METRIVYRIENPKDKGGMWYDGEGNFNPTIHLLCPNAIAKDFPMGFCDDHQREGKRWQSAGKNIENMNQWFSREDAENLVANGFHLYKFEVTEWYEKEMEILFTREGVVAVEIIPIDHVWVLSEN